MYDLSLIAPLDIADQKRIRNDIRTLLGDVDSYWEDENCDIGFHITLFEFFTHIRPPDSLVRELRALSTKILSSLNQGDAPHQTIARTRQAETFPGALFSYADFLGEQCETSDWHNDIRVWCEGAVRHATNGKPNGQDPNLNLMRVPFPVHITLCRFDKLLNDEAKKRVRDFITKVRYREFLHIPIKSVWLAAATRTPYRGLSLLGEVLLKGGHSDTN